MKISFIATVFNEEKTVSQFLNSIFTQTVKPDEIIIVDGGSTDATASIISNYPKKFKFITKKGNRAVGRNEAVRLATGNIIVCSDAGCVLDKEWIKNIIVPFHRSDVVVVAGFYKGVAKNIFEKCLVPYVLVMPDRVNPITFLPASRSMAFRKTVWEKIGGFPVEYSFNEDFVFAQRLKKGGAKIAFAKDAIVFWLSRKNLQEAFHMFYRFAFGDIEAGILRPKVVLLFSRYILGFALLVVSIASSSLWLLVTWYLLLVAYFIWAITKNFRYVGDYRAILVLPVIQLTADLAVLTGTSIGIIISIGRIFKA